jgi:hypothetical protein
MSALQPSSRPHGTTCHCADMDVVPNLVPDFAEVRTRVRDEGDLEFS